MPRVHPFVEEVDGLSLTRTVDAGHQDQDGEILFLQQVELRLQQGFPELWLLALVTRLGDAVADLGGFEHRLAPPEGCGDTQRAGSGPGPELQAGARPRASKANTTATEPSSKPTPIVV